MALWSWLEGLGVRILGWFGLQAATARQLIRFFLVGGIAAVTYVAVMAIVVDGFGGRVLLGAFLAFVLATAVSFVGNALWSFGARLTAAKAAMFFAVNTVGLGLNMLIAWLLERAGVHYLLISLTVLIVVPLFNFAGHRLITFARA
ncbi:MAG TPA: GtrA family protein [Reyranella sp.]|nr:GtrA family protein [Reyranella sp.]